MSTEQGPDRRPVPGPTGPPTWLPEDRPAPIPGWQLFLAFAGLLVLAAVLPLVTGGGTDAEPLASDPGSAFPLLFIAAGALAAGLSGRQGYDVGIALGGGAVAVFAVVVSIVIRLVVLLFDLSEAFGGSSTPGPGLVALGVAGVVGLMSIVPALKVALSAEGRPVHPLLALGGLVGSGLYLYGLLQPVVASGQPLWTGDVWTDASLALLIAALAGGGLIVGLRRTGAACGFLGGVMLFPAATWLAELGDEPSAFETTQTLGRTETAVGLGLAMAVAVIGTFTAATKAQSGPSGVARVPAHSNGALTAALSVVAIVALAGLAAEDSGDGSDVYTDESDFFGDDSSDGFSDDFSDDGGSWVDDDSTWTEDDPGFGDDFGEDDFGEDDFGEDDFFGDDYDDYGGDGCPPPDYDCVDDDFFGD